MEAKFNCSVLDMLGVQNVLTSGKVSLFRNPRKSYLCMIGIEAVVHINDLVVLGQYVEAILVILEFKYFRKGVIPKSSIKISIGKLRLNILLVG